MRAPETIDRAVAIARGDALEGQNWAQLSPKGRDTAELGLRRVLAAGYRILGPDEVDTVTLERAAELIEAHEEVTNLKTGKRLLHERTAGNLVGLAYAEGIRALGRKE